MLLFNRAKNVFYLFTSCSAGDMVTALQKICNCLIYLKMMRHGMMDTW